MRSLTLMDGTISNWIMGFMRPGRASGTRSGPSARQEILDRLLELNHERYTAEVAAGLHDKKRGKRDSGEQGELFG